jgi:small-conductance mechanosensitive channel
MWRLYVAIGIIVVFGGYFIYSQHEIKSLSAQTASAQVQLDVANKTIDVQNKAFELQKQIAESLNTSLNASRQSFNQSISQTNKATDSALATVQIKPDASEKLLKAQVRKLNDCSEKVVNKTGTKDDQC